MSTDGDAEEFNLLQYLLENGNSLLWDDPEILKLVEALSDTVSESIDPNFRELTLQDLLKQLEENK